MLSFKILTLRGFLLKCQFFFIALADFESPCSKELFSICVQRSCSAFMISKKKKTHVKAKELFFQFVGFGSPTTSSPG